MSSRLKLAFFIHELLPVGGVGTWFYYVLPDLHKYHDVVLFYDKADTKQLKRLNDIGITTKQLSRRPSTVFDILFRGYDKDPDIDAKHYVHTLHACVSECDFLFSIHGRIDSFLAVSEEAKSSFKKLYPNEKRPIYVVPNYVPVVPISPTKRFDNEIKMVVASRLTPEKGLRHLFNIVKILDERNINYQIDLFTIFQKIPHLDNGKVKFYLPRLDIDFSKYHYLIQLSDSEAYCYTVHEALSVGTAVIVNNLPVFNGIVKHGYNGYIYPNLDNINDIPVRFNYKPTGSIEIWLNYLKKVIQ